MHQNVSYEAAAALTGRDFSTISRAAASGKLGPIARDGRRATISVAALGRHYGHTFTPEQVERAVKLGRDAKPAAPSLSGPIADTITDLVMIAARSIRADMSGWMSSAMLRKLHPEGPDVAPISRSTAAAIATAVASQGLVRREEIDPVIAVAVEREIADRLASGVIFTREGAFRLARANVEARDTEWQQWSRSWSRRHAQPDGPETLNHA